MKAKDFSELAAILKDARLAALATVPATAHPQVSRIHDSMARSMAVVLSRQSGRFDKARFLAACGLSA